jgi:hypothetical protein
MGYFASAEQTEEGQPLLRAKTMSHKTIGGLWAVVIVAFLSISWCVLDAWNHDMTGQIFGMQEVTGIDADRRTGAITGEEHKFAHPLTLAFVQFGFMALAFLMLFSLVESQPLREIAKARNAFLHTGKWRSVSLVVTHAFSVFWLQSLMMPKQMLSIGLFAASRAVEIPAAAGLRARMLGVRFGGHPIATTALMFCSAWLLFFAYSQMANCLCVWSGFGVALTGPALIGVYALVLTLPVANAVCQEACMVQLEMHPVLMLAVMNLFSFFMFIPIVLGAQLSGWEDVLGGVAMIMRHREAAMLVLWLCVEMAFTSGTAAGLIFMVDSFWAVSLRSLRVVFWWARQIIPFYFASGGALLSTTHPHTSFWSFIMVCGLVFLLGAIVSDTQTGRSASTEKAKLDRILRQDSLASAA